MNEASIIEEAKARYSNVVRIKSALLPKLEYDLKKPLDVQLLSDNDPDYIKVKELNGSMCYLRYAGVWAEIVEYEKSTDYDIF